jgi:hypothetical protein
LRRLFLLPLALLAACSSEPIGINGKTADQISVEGDLNACDPRDRLMSNPLDAPSQTATTELQRRIINCRGPVPPVLLRDERVPKAP